ncbi:MAG TPA: DUF3341 domain-containing protein [Oligoflexus sp.]|uniref:DUF3341 domain-containing protein n=1 Tax=Oligoflexus sp. TaxID=1971216 RepID=UPI002D803128|nr:DUF3341 domain-containing protein [Oligoflexus sp.]HET9241292.1 DUF3341 domain-containing protein [Oligoflexus sp.]
MTPGRELYGIMMAFDGADQAREAAQKLHQEGFRALDAFTPYPVEDMPEALGLKKSWLPKAIFCGGLLGGLSGYALQYWASAYAYPLVIGGRPLNSIPVFIPITFETTVLAAALTATFGMLIANRLPRLNHPVFNVPEFERASVDRFFVCVRADDPRFDYEHLRSLMNQLPHEGIHDVRI